MSNKINRPPGMSQLDYLWSNFGSYVVSDSIDTPDSIPTSEAVKELVGVSDTGIVELGTEKLSTHQIRVYGKDKNGNELTSIQLDEDTKIISFQRHEATQEDVLNGYASQIGELCLVLKTSRDEQFWININDLILTGQETNTIYTQVVDSKIASTVKVNNSITTKSVRLNITDNGLSADLIINPDTQSNVLLLKGDKGVETKFVWDETETPVGLKLITFPEYQLITPKEGVLYFLTDVPAIFLNGIKFSSVINSSDFVTKEQFTQLDSKLDQEIQDRINGDADLEQYFNWFDV